MNYNEHVIDWIRYHIQRCLDLGMAESARLWLREFYLEHEYLRR